MKKLKTITEIKKNTLNLVGHAFGDLLVLTFSHYYNKHAFWNCKCSCGKEITVNQKDLFSFEVTNCGCKQEKVKFSVNKSISEPRMNNQCGVTGVYYSKNDNIWVVSITYKRTTYIISSYQNFEHAVYARLKAEEIIDYMKKEDLKNNPPPPRPPKKPTRNLVGEKFGKLTVISLVQIDKHAVWHCVCECGNEKDFYQENLLSGSAKSCGCEQKKLAKELSKKHIHVYKGIQIEKAMAKTTPRNNTSGFRGVMLDKKSGRYRVRMILQGVRYELGWYSDFEEAKKARIVAEEKRDAIVEEYLNLNDLLSGEKSENSKNNI